MISVLIALSSNEGSGKSAQMRRLVRAFAAHIHKAWMVIEDSGQKSDLYPHWICHNGGLKAFKHMRFVTKCHVVAHLLTSSRSEGEHPIP